MDHSLRALQETDWKFCTCPPDPLRDYEMGKRSQPSHEEVQRHREERWRELVTNVPEEVKQARFKKEHDRIDAVIAAFCKARAAVPAGPQLPTLGTALCTPTQSAPPSWGAQAAEKTGTSSKVRRVHSRRLTASKASKRRSGR